MIIPCIENKCIVYPMCRNREHISCPHIMDYYIKMRDTYGRDETWQYIKMCLKAMRTFSSGENGTIDYVYLEEYIKPETYESRVYGQEPI